VAWQVVQSGGKNIEIAVLRRDKGLEIFESSEVDRIVKEIEAEKEQDNDKKKQKKPAGEDK
jgi:20S proteasome subunit alpha 4